MIEIPESTSAPKIVMLGPFPPPVHGVSAINDAMHQRLIAHSAQILIIDTAAPDLNRSGAWLRRFPAVFRGWWRLATTPRLSGCALYMSVSGGAGQLFELISIVIARSRRMRPVMHHHSFAYLDIVRVVTALLVSAAGARATHVALSERMAALLRNQYGAKKVMSVSNAAFMLPSNVSESIRSKLTTVGFLSNIAAEKGIIDFLNLMEVLHKAGHPVRGLIAGPFQDSEIEALVLERLKQLPEVSYVGAKYGHEKEVFFSLVDVLVFPTRYNNEAEPLTIIEALARCIPVISFGRGAIPEILGSDCGKVIAPGDDFVDEATSTIVKWLENPQALKVASRNARERFERVRAAATRGLAILKTALLGRESSDRQHEDNENASKEEKPTL